MPPLTRLLRRVKRVSPAKQEAVRAAMSEAEAEFARLEVEARKGG